jgi:hypothetical protein
MRAYGVAHRHARTRRPESYCDRCKLLAGFEPLRVVVSAAERVAQVPSRPGRGRQWAARPGRRVKTRGRVRPARPDLLPATVLSNFSSTS